MDLSDVLWIGGAEGSGTAALADALSRRFGLQRYSLDEQAAAHEARMPRTELHADPLQRFVTTSRHRFRLVLEDLAGLPAAGPTLVEGIELLPTSVAAVLRRPEQALFLVGGSKPLDLRIAREAVDLRLHVLRADRPLAELVEAAAQHFGLASAAEQIGRRDDHPEHEAE